MTSAEALAAKPKSFTAAWAAFHRSLERLMSDQSDFPKRDNYGVTTLAMALSSLPMAQTLEQPEMSRATEALIKTNKDAKTKRSVRFSFVVLSVLNKGWGGGTGNSSGAKNVREQLTYLVQNKHVRMHLFEMLGLDQRGARSPLCVVLSPGMVLSMSVWSSTTDRGDKIHEVFANQTTDIKPFDLLMVELSTKSTKVDKSEQANEAKLMLRKVSQLPKATAASVLAVPSRLASPSVDYATRLSVHHAAGTHLTPEALSVRGPLETGLCDEDIGTAPCDVAIEGWQQSLMRNNLATTVFFIHTVPTSGTVGAGPDDVLRFYGNEAFLEATGLKVHTFAVKYDERQYAPMDWAIRLFNVAILGGALEMLVAADLYGGSDGSREPNVTGFLRIRHSAMVDTLLNAKPAADLPACVVDTFSDGKREATLKHLVAFPFGKADGDQWFVLDTRDEINKRHNTEDAPLWGALVPKTNAAWVRGHMVYVFVDGRLVFYFVAPVAVAGVRIVASVSGRSLETLDLPAESSEEDEAEVKRQMTPPPMPTPALPPPVVRKRKTAVPHGKRKRSVTEEESDELDDEDV